MEKLLADIEYNYKKIEERIAEAALKSGRTREDITFLSATKTVSPELINYAISLGLKYIGENRVQELLSKYDAYNLNDATLHFIGHLQTNKVKQIVDKVKMIQSVDSVKLAKEISKQSVAKGINTDILVEINIGNEDNKSGVLPEQAEDLLWEISKMDNVFVKGLMTIPPICENEQKIRKYFHKMHNIFIDISGKKIDNISMEVLSMGMSSDYYEAITEGATMVRIGSSLFGERDYSK